MSNIYHDYELTKIAQANGYGNVESYLHALRCEKEREKNRARRERYAQIQGQRMTAATPSTICRPVPRGV